jgi:hypothetical protein
MRIRKSPHHARTRFKLFLEVEERLPDKDSRTGKKKNTKGRTKTAAQ